MSRAKRRLVPRTTGDHRRELADVGARLLAAKAALYAARRDLARLSRAGGSLLVDRRHAAAVRVLNANRARLDAHRDVVGYGLGYRKSNGTSTREPVLTIFVHNKLALSKLSRTRLLAALRAGKTELAVDVVQFGTALTRQVSVGASVGKTTSPRTRGTLGSFAIDTAGATYAITAMHVTTGTELAIGDPVIAISSPSRLDDAAASTLGSAELGTMTDVDAVRIRLQPGVNANWSAPTIGPINGWRQLHYPGDAQTAVRMYGAVSGYQEGHIENPSADFPVFGLRDALVVRIHSVDGDSGAALVDSEGLVLGFLVGAGSNLPGDLRLFCPASLVLQRLACDIPRRSP
jgi:hypothetical protein